MTDFSSYNLTPTAKQSLIKAQEVAMGYQHLKVIDIHLLYSVIQSDQNNIKYAMELNGWLIEGMMTALEMVLDQYKEPKRKYKVFAPEIFKILDESKILAKKTKDNFIGVDHMLITILQSRKDIKAFFIGLNVDVNKFCHTLVYIIKNGIDYNSPPPMVEVTPAPVQSAPTKKKQNISDWCEDINETIKERGTFEIFGREKEIERSCEILLRKNKSNIILVGEAGVGKTAIVEGLAEKIIQNKCPRFLKNKKILSLDMTSVLAGTMYRGQMEEKVKQIIDKISNSDEYILFIDEIHTIVGSGSSEGSLDLANSLKPVLSRGNFSCIGATTKNEYEKYFKGDSALNRRFEKINVLEPNQKETLKLLMKAKLSYEKFHNVKFSLSIIKKIINLCDKYLPEKKFPDKAFDIIDEAGAKTKINNSNIKEPLKVELNTVYIIFAQKLNTTVDNVKNDTNISVGNQIGFM
jgi:ATP-dependent Clp protease ATP-binding subunit ClpC